MIDREETIADVLIFISEYDSIREMRHQILRIANKLKPIDNLPMVKLGEIKQ